MSAPLAPDDVVATHAAAASNAREPLVVVAPLRAFLAQHGLVDGTGGELVVEPLGDGHSNVTLLVGCGGRELVLRRPPRGPLPPSAHDVLREARLLRALEPTAARVPRVLAVGDDPELIGAPFYLMERVRGEVLTSSLPVALDTPAQRRAIGEELVDALVEVHGVDWRAVGLEGFSTRPEGYLERQLGRFLGLWEYNRTRDIAAVQSVGAWLRKHLPSSPAPTIVHGDYRLGNVMLAPDAPARVSAVLDWEMATIGDPLADVGYLCALWVQRDDPPLGMFELSGVTREDGFLTRDELVARYERGSGRSMTDVRWYRTLALWKAAVFMEGNYRRAVAGSTDDPWLHGFGEGVVALAERAERLTRER
ncbi:MAG TPA: phosphotransferase family protein [Solirubrobacteraceae bacterium]|nr:phosphotransferase family protein [Solirubrobacteraceae bacterium]